MHSCMARHDSYGVLELVQSLTAAIKRPSHYETNNTINTRELGQLPHVKVHALSDDASGSFQQYRQLEFSKIGLVDATAIESSD